MKISSLLKNLRSLTPREKRYGRRLLAQDLFMVEFKRHGKTLMEKGFGCDLSLTGAKFNTLVPFEKGKNIHMVFRFSPEYGVASSVDLSGRIIYAKKSSKTYYYQVGCHFNSGQEKQKQILQNFLGWISSLEAAGGAPLAQCRRSRSRIQAKDVFLLEFKRGGKKILHKGYGCDLSPLGASFMTLADLTKGEKIGTILHFSPEFPGPKTLELVSEVLRLESSRNSPYGLAACRFQDPKGLTRWTIKQFLNWLKTKKQ